VLVADVNAGGAAETVKLITGEDGEAVDCVVDITDPEQVHAMVEAAVDAFGGLDIAVNNAGTAGVIAPISDYPLDVWRQVVDINLTGTFLCLQAEIPKMRERGGGVIVNTASNAGFMAAPGMAPYISTKHAVVGLTRTAALECIRENIRINAICPGTTLTPLFEGFLGPDQATALGESMPIGRLAEPDEIAAAIVWMCSPASSYMVGHPLIVDGGLLAT
jgi:NAD(P)-dependent dehydrogenase (short-subunit alcohol dehydrogenase family)